MTTTQTQMALGIAAGLATTAVLYLTVPAYHDLFVWSWGLAGIDIVSIFG